MSNMVVVRQALLALVGTTLGAPYKELPFQYGVDKNDSRSLQAGYAVRYGQANQSYDIDQAVNLEHDFEVEITSRVFVRNSDDKVEATLDGIYNLISPLLNKILMEKVGIPATIQRAELRSMGEPHLIGEGRDTLSITLGFRVRYLNL